MSARFVDGAAEVRTLIELALSGVEKGIIQPVIDIEDREDMRIALGTDDGDAFLRLSRKGGSGTVWVSLIDDRNLDYGYWTDHEVGHLVVRSLWDLCRNRCYESRTEEIIADLQRQFRRQLGLDS